MSVAFFLKDKNKPKSPLILTVAYMGKYFKQSSGISVTSADWDQTKQRTRDKKINERLKPMLRAAEDTADYFANKGIIPAKETFWAQYEQLLSGAAPITKEVLFTDYFAAYLERVRVKLVRETANSYGSAYNKMLEYEAARKTRLRFEDIDIDFFRGYEEYFYSLRKPNGAPYSFNYFGSIMKCVIAVYVAAREVDKLHDLHGTDHKDFAAKQKTADTIYLSEEELLRIYRLKITSQLVIEHFDKTDTRPHNLAKTVAAAELSRKKFLIGAFTALRVSDFNHIQSVNLKENRIVINTKKTGARVVIPIHWVVREIMESGFDVTTKLSDQKLNKHIKRVCKMAGITEDIETVHHAGGRRLVTVSKKYELVTTHTCRRSGATNMALSGIDLNAIRMITGHSSIAMLMKYLKISPEENARTLESHPFFAGRGE